jgi:amidase
VTGRGRFAKSDATNSVQLGPPTHGRTTPAKIGSPVPGVWPRRRFGDLPQTMRRTEHSPDPPSSTWLSAVPASCRWGVAAASLVLGLALAAVPAADAKPRSGPPAFAFAEATIDDLQNRMSQGTLTAQELTAAYLRRIKEIDQAGPELNAVIEVNPDAMAIAAGCDAERRAGRVRGPLHGIPVLIKDNIDTADRMATTAGSLALVGARPARDAALVTRLREAGAVILGKTNLSEWAGFRSTASLDGWSARRGLTHNPYALDRSASGSSSGSAAAVTANLCVVAIGTETDGSIMSPASVNGIVGVKPTVGLVSRAGIIPISVSQDTAGPMARTVRDAALLLGVLAGADAADGSAAAQPAGLSSDVMRRPSPGGLKGARIGVVRGPFGFSPNLQLVLNEAVAALRAAGAEIVDPLEFRPGVQRAEEEVLLYEFKDGLNRYLAALGPKAPVRSLADVIDFNRRHSGEELALFDQELLERAQAKGPLTEPGYRAARATCLRLARTEGIDAMMAAHRLDALVALTNSPAWPSDPINGDHSPGGSAALAAVAGYPSVTVPAAQVSGLPVGLSFVGRAWSEARLLSLAADFERLVQARREPRFLAPGSNREGNRPR